MSVYAPYYFIGELPIDATISDDDYSKFYSDVDRMSLESIALIGEALRILVLDDTDTADSQIDLLGQTYLVEWSEGDKRT